MKIEGPMVWVFSGTKADFPSGVFSTREKADEWIRRMKVSGTLTAYPLDEPVYDWAVRVGAFQPRREDQKMAEFIQRFSAASQDHFHYENGRGG